MKHAIVDLLSPHGNRTFTMSERQFHGLLKGHTHLGIMDEKSIVESIYETGSAPDCFNDLDGNGICEHATEGENGEIKLICGIIGSCKRQQIVDHRPIYYQTFCNHALPKKTCMSGNAAAPVSEQNPEDLRK
jgi:hypothetical protein